MLLPLLQFVPNFQYSRAWLFTPHTMALTFIKSEKGKTKLFHEDNYVCEKHQDNPTKTKLNGDVNYSIQSARPTFTRFTTMTNPSVFRSESHTHALKKHELQLIRCGMQSMRIVRTSTR